MRSKKAWLVMLIILCLVSVGCSSAEETPPQSNPGPVVESSPTAAATATPEAQPTEEPSSSPSALQPYPYTTPLPPPIPTELDGVYIHKIKFEGTPTPCRRCAPYRAEGGTWTLRLDKGAFHISHDSTDFTGVGSFSLDGQQLLLFNDPNCHTDIGAYTWELDGRSLRLEAMDDTCGFGLRVKNLTAGSWVKQTDEEGRLIDSCQPPSTEAAITSHWPAPADCQTASKED